MKKARPRAPAISQIPGPVFLTFLFLLPFPVSFIILTLRLIEGSDIFPYNEIFLHLISGLPILREGLFFLGHEAGVFHIQILHSRNPPWGQEPICENRSFSIAIYALTRFYNGICSRNRLLYYLRLEYIDFSDELRYNLLALV